MQNNDTDRELKNLNKKIARLKERKSSLVDMRLDDKIDEEIYQIKIAEVNEKMDGLLLQKQSLKDRQEEQQDINKRLSEFQKVISSKEVLKQFDRHVFESIIDRVIVGKKAENGEINPYKLKFIFKTGYEKDEVASEQPFSFGNSCSNTNNDCDIISLQGDNDTCGGCLLAIEQTLILCGLAGFFEEYVPVFLADKNVYRTWQLKRGAKFAEA